MIGLLLRKFLESRYVATYFSGMARPVGHEKLRKRCELVLSSLLAIFAVLFLYINVLYTCGTHDTHFELITCGTCMYNNNIYICSIYI